MVTAIQTQERIDSIILESGHSIHCKIHTGGGEIHLPTGHPRIQSHVAISARAVFPSDSVKITNYPYHSLGMHQPVGPE